MAAHAANVISCEPGWISKQRYSKEFMEDVIVVAVLDRYRMNAEPAIKINHLSVISGCF